MTCEPTILPISIKSNLFDTERLNIPGPYPFDATITETVENLVKILDFYPMKTFCTSCNDPCNPRHPAGVYPPLPNAPNVCALLYQCHTECGEYFDSVAVDLSNLQHPLVRWTRPNSPTMISTASSPQAPKRKRDDTSPGPTTPRPSKDRHIDLPPANPTPPTIPPLPPTLEQTLATLASLAPLVTSLQATISTLQNRIESLEARLSTNPLPNDNSPPQRAPMSYAYAASSMPPRPPRNSTTLPTAGGIGRGGTRSNHTPRAVPNPTSHTAPLNFKDAFRTTPPPAAAPRVVHAELTSIFVQLHPTTTTRVTTKERIKILRDYQKELNIYDKITRTRSVGASLYHLLLPCIHVDSVTATLREHNIPILDDVNLEQPSPYILDRLLDIINEDERDEARTQIIDESNNKLIDIAAHYLLSIPARNRPLRDAFLRCFPTLRNSILANESQLLLTRPAPHGNHRFNDFIPTANPSADPSPQTMNDDDA
jgi:hypothetical protein